MSMAYAQVAASPRLRCVLPGMRRPGAAGLRSGGWCGVVVVAVRGFRDDGGLWPMRCRRSRQGIRVMR
jgi:hypothetical protein